VASPKLSRRVEKVLPYAPLSGVKFGMFCATVLICPTRQSQTSSCMPTIEALKASGVDWTVVSPSFAMETALAVQARLLAATGAMCGCTAREPLSLVAAGDVARASVAVLDDGPAWSRVPTRAWACARHRCGGVPAEAGPCRKAPAMKLDGPRRGQYPIGARSTMGLR
jgi:hypothetical protein